MSDLITRTARLVPYMKRPKQVPSFVTAYSYEPLPDEPGAKFGSLYVVMEVLVSGRASEEVADLIIETIGEQYYNQPHTSEEPLNRFEAAIKSANQALGEHVNRGNAAWIGKLSAVIAVHVGNELHVAGTGSAEAFLYRGKAATRISASGPNRPTTPNKTFGSIASGQLEVGDRLLLATPALIHQVSLGRLQGLMSQSSPNAAIAEITNLLHGTSTERIAALVIEITTPELAALQVRSEQPSEIQLGAPENALEAAKLAATPIAHTTIASSKKVATVANTGWQRAKPHARVFSLMLVDKLRQLLSSKRGRMIVLIIAAIIIIISIIMIWNANSSAANAKLFSQYQGVYSEFQQSQQLLETGNKTDARNSFVSTQQHLAELQKHRRKIDQQLSRDALPEAEPKTMAALGALINDRLDQIDGLLKIDPTTITSLPAKNARPEHFEVFNDKAYVFDAGNQQALSIINVLTGSINTSSVNTSKLGTIAGTTLSSNQDGIFILTTTPSVWFYRFDTDTLAEQSIAYGAWPKAYGLASYASNLYLLSDGVIYKHTKNAGGFSPKSTYLTIAEEAKGATSLAIDGSLYLSSSTGLHTYLAGQLKQSTPIPGTLKAIKNLRSTPNGMIIAGVSTESERIGLWTTRNNTATFARQIALNNVTSLHDAVYDTKTSTVFAVVDSRLVRFSVRL